MMRRFLVLAGIGIGLIWQPALGAGGHYPSLGPAQAAELRGIVAAMKVNPRGPFSRIRWFCADGTILAPKAYACVDHGGGRLELAPCSRIDVVGGLGTTS